MTSLNPQQKETYLGPITDTSRWENFKHRPDDIFICTPPKCGTTWTQAICAMLIFGKVDHGLQPGVISPWIDAAFAPIEDYLLQVEEQNHRRFIKTHTPFDGIPYFEECNYLVVFRDPRDAYFSGLNHRDNMTDQELAESAFPSGANAYNDWLMAEREPGTWDLQSVDSLCHFFKTYWSYRDLPNVHFFHYSDMKKDLNKAVTRISNALGLSYSESQIAAFAEGASFDKMKNNAAQFAPESGTGIWKKEGDFFASGKNNQWKGKLSAEQLTAFDERLRSLLSNEEADWILNLK